MSRPRNWLHRKRLARLRSLRDSSLTERYLRGLAERAPHPHGLDLTDSRGRPITLPRVSILEMGEIDTDPSRPIRRQVA